METLSTLLRRKHRANVLIALLLLISAGAHAQLSGTYTVCPSGCDYYSIQLAADDLQSLGISGPVTMEISPNTYKEAVKIGPISGASAAWTVTFKGMGSKPA